MGRRDGFDLEKEFDPDIHNPWMKLIKGLTIGKKAIVPLIGGSAQVVPSSITLLSIQSTDPYAQQLSVTLQPPKFMSNAAVTALLALGGEPSGEFDNQVPNFPTGLTLGNPSVIVQWGIGGTFDDVEADFGNGLCLNIPGASFLRVTCKMDSLNIPSTSDVAYVLSAFVGPGYPKALNAQKTVFTGDSFTEKDQVSDIFPVPKHAKMATLLGIQGGTVPGDSDTFSGSIIFLRGNDFTLANMISETFFDETTHYPINVPNGAFFFVNKNLTTTVADTTVRMETIFDLSV
jgi:hypothetical protein